MWRRERPAVRRRLPVSFRMSLTGEALIPSWGPEGKVMWMCFMPELFPVDNVGRDVRRLFWGGTFRALPDAG